MNRVLKRQVLRMGGSSGTGVTSGLDRPGYKDAGTVQAALDTTQKSLTALDQFREKQSGFMPGALPGEESERPNTMSLPSTVGANLSAQSMYDQCTMYDQFMYHLCTLYVHCHAL